MRGVFSTANDLGLFLMTFPRVSLHYKLVLFQYREHQNGLNGEITALIYKFTCEITNFPWQRLARDFSMQ